VKEQLRKNKSNRITKFGYRKCKSKYVVQPKEQSKEYHNNHIVYESSKIPPHKKESIFVTPAASSVFD